MFNNLWFFFVGLNDDRQYSVSIVCHLEFSNPNAKTDSTVQSYISKRQFCGRCLVSEQKRGVFFFVAIQ